jgi:8-oxo-dGTP pyrophosphatase MutT (NUDIX family)
MLRRCSGAVPYRFKAGAVEVLLVKSSSGDRWVFPKGGVEPGLNARTNAVKEAWEEAGVVGKINNWLQTIATATNQTSYFMLFVVALADVYPEQRWRERSWVEVNAARLLLVSDYHTLLDELLEKLS